MTVISQPSLSRSLYIYLYTHMECVYLGVDVCVDVYVCVYNYMYIHILALQLSPCGLGSSVLQAHPAWGLELMMSSSVRGGKLGHLDHSKSLAKLVQGPRLPELLTSR